MKYYKIVRVSSRGKRHSCYLWKRSLKFPEVTSGVMDREYSELFWTHPPEKALRAGYGLTCFGSHDSADCFYDYHNEGDLELWECRIGKEIKELPKFYHNIIVNLKKILSGDGYEAYDDWPEGTIMTDKVKLIKRIK